MPDNLCRKWTNESNKTNVQITSRAKKRSVVSTHTHTDSLTHSLICTSCIEYAGNKSASRCFGAFYFFNLLKMLSMLSSKALITDNLGQKICRFLFSVFWATKFQKTWNVNGEQKEEEETPKIFSASGCCRLISFTIRFVVGAGALPDRHF